MKIYIMERDNPQTRQDPEIFYSMEEAAKTVEDEVEQAMKDLNITEEDLDKQYGYYEVRYANDVLCSASLVDEWSGERYDWRITEHIIKIRHEAHWVYNTHAYYTEGQYNMRVCYKPNAPHDVF